MGVTSKNSTERQARLVSEICARTPTDKRMFVFVNVSATHQPNCIFAPDEQTVDTTVTQAYALQYADRHLADLFRTMKKRAPVLVIICSDHGTAYGEGGCFGHRHNDPSVLTVPYAEFSL